MDRLEHYADVTYNWMQEHLLPWVVRQIDSVVTLPKDAAIAFLIGVTVGLFFVLCYRFKVQHLRRSIREQQQHMVDSQQKLSLTSSQLSTARKEAKRNQSLLLQEQEKQRLKKESYKTADIRNPHNQLRFVGEVVLSKKRLMNREEYPYFESVEKYLLESNSYHRIMAQANMGQFLQVVPKQSIPEKKREMGRRSINSKRVDFLIIDGFGSPAIAIEYQGTGHYQNNADKHDRVKQLALRKAQVVLIEVFPDNSPKELVTLVETILSRPTGVPVEHWHYVMSEYASNKALAG